MGSPEHLTVLPGSDLVGPGHRHRRADPGGLGHRGRAARSGFSVPGLVDGVVFLLAASWVSLVVGLAFWSVVPMALGAHPELVLTGSMQPGIDPGDVVLVVPPKPPTLPGHIVLVEDTSRHTGTYLHRIMRYDDDGNAITKGDANPTEDFPAVDPARIKGEARLLVPAIGRPMIWVREGNYAPVAFVVLLTWLAAVTCLSSESPTQLLRRLVRGR